MLVFRAADLEGVGGQFCVESLENGGEVRGEDVTGGGGPVGVYGVVSDHTAGI